MLVRSRVFGSVARRVFSTDAAPYIPVIDLTPFFEGTPEGKALVARQVDDACRNIGFFTVVGHGVDKAVIDNAWNATRSFFDLPVNDKA
jgi:isopenicillin N synthase-like dioxygenase